VIGTPLRDGVNLVAKDHSHATYRLSDYRELRDFLRQLLP